MYFAHDQHAAADAANTRLREKVKKSESVLASASELGAATGQLPLVSMLAFGLPIAQIMFFTPADVNDGSIAQTIYVTALPISAALSAYPIAFSLLETYYIGLMKSVAEERKGAGEAGGVAEERKGAGEAGGVSFQVDDADFARRLSAMLDSFETMRAYARNAVWGGMTVLMFGVASKYVSMSGLTLVSAVASTSLVAGIVTVFLTVRTFRSAYWPLIHDLTTLSTTRR